MSDAEPDPDPTATSLKHALWLPLGTLVDATTIPHSTNATPHFIGALTELVYSQIAKAAGEVEAFARHAGRTTVRVQDVMLLARNSEGLKVVLEEEEVKSREGGMGNGKGKLTGKGR